MRQGRTQAPHTKHRSPVGAGGLCCALLLATACEGGVGLDPGVTHAATRSAASGMGVPKPLPGDRLAYRFVDHVGEAVFEGPALSGALSTMDWPYKMVNPYSGLRGEAALRTLEVAVVETAVEQYPARGVEAPATGDQAAPAAKFDPVWNRHRGVYESKVSLFAPAPSCYRYRVALPTAGTLTFQYAVVPGKTGMGTSAATVFEIQVDGAPKWQGQATATATGHWLAGQVALSGGVAQALHEVAFCTRVPPEASGTAATRGAAGFAVWGNPQLWAVDEGAAGPNVLLILVDTLRADALSAMPRLRAYSEQNVGCTQAITAATWTRPSILALLGGDLATTVGQSAEDMIPSERERKKFYALDRRLLPRLLREAGYESVSVGNNFFLLGYPQIGLSLGFDEVADVRHPVADSPAITRAALAFLAQHQRRSFFLQLHYDAPHWPYTPPAPFGKTVPDAHVARLMGRAGLDATGGLDPQVRAYLGEAEYADAQIAQVLDQLHKLQLDERTLVIIVGDHGEILDPQHNHYVAAQKQPTLYHHGWSAYDEILRVPLVLGMPGRLPRGVVVTSQVRLVDVAPTVLDVLGLPSWRAVLPSGLYGRGESLLPLLLPRTGDSATGQTPGKGGDRPAFVEGQGIRALRSEGYLYLRRSDPRLQRAQGNEGQGPTLRVSEELYDLASDPAQHHDLLLKQGRRGASWALADATVGPVLRRMRSAFLHETPASPQEVLPLLHLMLAADGRVGHTLSGTLTSSDLSLVVKGVREGEVTPRAPGRIEVLLRPGGMLDVLVDPGARLELLLNKDGLPLAAGELLLGPFGLPLLRQETPDKPPPGGVAPPGPEAEGVASGVGEKEVMPIVLDGPVLERLSGTYPPVPGARGDVLLWRDATAAGATAAGSAKTKASHSEVETLMRDWGYLRKEPEKGK